MPRIDEGTKLSRLRRLLSVLRHAPHGLSEQQLAETLGLERRTINNYLRELELDGRVYKEGVTWLFDTEHSENRLRPLEVTPEEAMTLYLATRLFVKQNDKRNEVAETALYKLAEVLTGDLNVGHEIQQAASELAQRPTDPLFSEIFQVMVQGYLYRRVIEVSYKPRGLRPFRATIHPYLLEPSGIGFTTYVIGYVDPPGALRTFKLERIQEASLTNQTFTIPADFPGLDVLQNAWSIIYGEALIEIILRFHPSVVDRVLETQWHTSQQTRPDPEKSGYLIWSVQIADTVDIMPWIRGWGADVEVLAPEELRHEVAGETARLARIYGADQNRDQDEGYQRLFGE